MIIKISKLLQSSSEQVAVLRQYDTFLKQVTVVFFGCRSMLVQSSLACSYKIELVNGKGYANPFFKLISARYGDKNSFWARIHTWNSIIPHSIIEKIHVESVNRWTNMNTGFVSNFSPNTNNCKINLLFMNGTTNKTEGNNNQKGKEGKGARGLTSSTL